MVKSTAYIISFLDFEILRDFFEERQIPAVFIGPGMAFTDQLADSSSNEMIYVLLTESKHERVIQQEFNYLRLQPFAWCLP